jgi:mannosyltransferase OCH1-like enzyme
MNKILFFNKKIIPLHVYQTWSTHDLPPFMKKTIEHNQTLNPEFKFHLYDDDDCFQFIKNHFSADILNAYTKLKPGAYKADLWRYCVLYVNGGIYMDVKVKLSFNFSLKELIYSEHYVKDIAGPFDNLGIYNAFMVHAPKNTLLLKCIDQIVLNVYNKYYGENPLCITGPALVGRLFILDKYDLKLVDIQHTHDGKLAYKNKTFATMYRQYRDEQRGNEQRGNEQRGNEQRRNKQSGEEQRKDEENIYLHYSEL